MIANLERLIPNLIQVQENIDEEILVIERVTKETEKYSKEERVRNRFVDWFRDTLTYLTNLETVQSNFKKWGKRLIITELSSRRFI
jgi:hypothetical protein